MSIGMVHFMQEAKGVDDFPRKEASDREGREKQQERERKRAIYIYRERGTFIRVVRAREFFLPFLLQNCS
jgi:hypothetical protein